MAIEKFAHKGLKRFFIEGDKSGIQPAHASKIDLILDLLNGATRPEDMNFPGSNLHPLKGNLKGYYSVHVNGNWTIIFKFENNNAYEVDLVDYH